MIINHKLEIDLIRRDAAPMLDAMQNDANTRALEITLLENGAAWEVPEGVKVALNYQKPDGTRGFYQYLPNRELAYTITGNTITFILAPQVLTAPGLVRASVVLHRDTEQLATQLAAFPLSIHVEGLPGMGGTQSENYYNYPTFDALNAAIGNLDDLDTEDKSSLVAAVNEAAKKAGSGTVKSVNGIEPDENGNVQIEVGSGVAASSVEPADDDIPKVFFGSPLQQTKDEIVTTFHYRSKTLRVDCYAEIKAQGNSTLNWPKKNQTVKLFEDAECTKKLKINFKGWGKQNKFVIKANWRDLTHVRDIVSVRLEGDCMRSSPDFDELPELLQTSPNLGGIDGFPVMVYAAGVYQGRYMWNIPKDKWMANMDDDLDQHCILCSENYKSGCFRAAANINGNDWTDEIHDTVPASIRNRWNEVIRFVMNSTDEEFVANLDSYIKVSTLIDRHLMGLLSCDFDGYGKNQLYITYDGQQWYAGRYDKDGTWGNYWSGSTMLPSNYRREQYEDFTSGDSNGDGNLLFIRLEQLFWERLQARWAELKIGALSIPNIINRFRELYDITPPHLIAEDYASTTANGAFTGIPNKTTCTIQQIQKFVVERHAWMDEYVAGLTPEIPVPCEGVTLSAETLTFTAEGTQTLTATVIPDGCTDTVTWESNNTSVATVNGGVVTAIANGNATITARCGNYSASCTVSVSGIAQPVPCTGITLDKSELSFTEEGSQTIVATVTPADTTDTIVWSSDNEAVATVVNGVVAAVGSGSCTVTATCGAYNATCAVSAELPLSPILYQAKNLDVSAGNVDTGVKLFENDIDFTIVYKATIPSIEGIGTLFDSLDSSVGQTFRARLISTALRVNYGSDYDKDLKISFVENSEATVIATHTAGSGFCDWAYSLKRTDGKDYFVKLRLTSDFIASSKTLVVSSMTCDSVDEFSVYSYTIDEYEVISIAIGLDTQEITNVTWSDTAKYSINNGDVASGTNYVTEAIAIPDNTVCTALCNVNGSTFRWHGVAQYDADMEFISYTETNGTSDGFKIVLADNAKYVKFSAYPKAAESDIPATGLAAAFPYE